MKQKTSEIGEPGQARLGEKKTFESNRHVEFIQPPKLARPESRNSILKKKTPAGSLSLSKKIKM